jgi:hypothetical protein
LKSHADILDKDQLARYREHLKSRTSMVKSPILRNSNQSQLTLKMSFHTILATRSLLLAATLLLPSCTYKYDTVSFGAVGKMPDAKTPVPKIEIDTNMSVGTLLGGSVKSKKPYDIQAFYLDDTFTFATAEFTTVTVTYADGTNDPGAAALKLPMRFQHKVHESHNSMDGGAVVVTKSRIIQAEFPGAITRDEPFTLLIMGRFTKDDGTTVPFTIKEQYEISRDRRTETWADFVSGC